MSEEQSLVRPSRRTLFGLLLPVLVVAGYYGGKAIVRAHVDNLIGASVGKPLPDFTLRDRAGAEWTPARLRGRPALLHFVRSRCESCELEAEDYRQLERELPADAVTILHVMTDAVLAFPADETAATVAREGFARPVLLADAAFVEAFHTVRWSNVTPVTYVVDRQGAIRSALRGRQTVAALREALAALE